MALGMFDGVHIGHRSLLNTAKADAQKLNCSAVAFTFDRHPKEVLGRKQRLLTTSEEKVRIINSLGLKVHMAKFTKEYASLEPEKFLDLLREDYDIKEIIVGFNFNFGKNAKGDAEYLKQYCKANDIILKIIQPVSHRSQVASSTIIRACLAEGDIEKANEMLQMPYFICGKVISRNQIGNKIGFPTANIETDKKVIPKNGVYATIASFLDSEKKPHFFRSMTNIGIRPSIIEANKEITIESHLIDFNEMIYGKKISISFFEYIRPEIRFSGLQELTRQIDNDKDFTLSYFSKLDYDKVTKEIYVP